MSSPAYDFSRFEKRETEQVTIKKIQGGAKAAPKARPVGAVLAAVLVVGILSAFIYTRGQLTEANDALLAANESLTALHSLNRELEIDLAGQMSIQNVEEAAKALGMDTMENYQIQYIEIPVEETAQISYVEKGWLESIWETVCGWFGG